MPKGVEEGLEIQMAVEDLEVEAVAEAVEGAGPELLIHSLVALERSQTS